MIETNQFKQENSTKATGSTLNGYLEDRYLHSPNDERTRSMIVNDIQTWYMSNIDLDRFYRDTSYKEFITEEIYKTKCSTLTILLENSGMSKEDIKKSILNMKI